MTMMSGATPAPKKPEGPADGHTFRFGVDVRGSYKIQDSADYRDATEFDSLPQFVEVRAWNLTDALQQAADIPLSEWFGEEESDDQGEDDRAEQAGIPGDRSL